MTRYPAQVSAGENAIRDELATRLFVIEVGLKFIASNYHLRNSHGADGFIDIVARDSTGVFVVIELKRSDSTARQALHEIGKYVDLLCRDKGLSPAQVRAMIVSTDWHELLVPFSYYARESDFGLTGYALELAGDGLTPQSAVEVDVLPAGRSRSLTASQRRIDGRVLGDVEQSWREIKQRLRDLDVEDFVGLHLSDDDGSKMIVLALGTIVSEVARGPMSAALLAAEAFDREDLDDIPTEELVLLGLEYQGLPLGVCYPEKVGALLAGTWTVDAVERAGVFKDEELFPVDDIMEMCEGWSGGLSTVHYSGRARTSHSANWTEFCGSLLHVAAESPGWVVPTRLWLDELQAANPRWDVSVNCYDSHDLLQSLLHCYKTDRWEEAVPFLSLAVEAPNNNSFGLFGYLRWDGTEVDVVAGLRAGYKNVGDWGDLRAFDLQAEANVRVLEAWHLSYVVTEKVALEEYPKSLTTLGGVLGRSPVIQSEFSDGLLRPLLMIDFIEAHEAQLDVLVAYLKDHVSIFPDTATQMHMFNGRVDGDWY